MTKQSMSRLFEPASNSAVAILGLFVLTLAACWPALFGGFIWDDGILARTRAIQEWSGLWDIWFSPGSIREEDHYWPVLYTSFWLEHKLWGLSAFPSHLVNIVLHAANTLLLWHILRRCSVPGAWLAAAVFAVHPIHIEAVAFIQGGRKDLLATLFYLCAVHVWLRFYTGATGAQPGWRHHMLLAVLLLAGVWSKTIAVTLPGALLLLHWWQQGRVSRQTLLQLASLVVLAALALAFDLYTHRVGMDEIPLDWSLPERVLIAAQSLCFYLGKLLWPSNLQIIYPHWNIGAARSWLSLLAVLLMAVLLWRYYSLGKLGRGAVAAMVFFVMALSLTLGFVNFGHMAVTFVSDRYQYLASIGPLTLGVAAVVRLARAVAASERLAPWPMPRMAALGLALGLGALTWMSAQHARVYQDEVRLLRYILDHNPQLGHVWIDLGYTLARRGQLEEALEATQTALAMTGAGGNIILPQASNLLHHRAGMIQLQLRQYEQARWHLQEALKTGLDDDWHVNRSVLYSYPEAARNSLRKGLYEEAVVILEVLTEARPRWAYSWADLGVALWHTGRYTEAITALEQASSLESRIAAKPEVHVLIARSAEALQQTERATRHYTQALALDPDFLPALEHLGELQFTRQQYSKALNAWQRLVALAPDSAAVHARLGATLAALGQTEAARDSLQRALALDPALATARTQLRELNTDPR